MQLESLVPLALALACPVGMVLMMRGASRHGAACHRPEARDGEHGAPIDARTAQLLERRRAIDAELDALRSEARSETPSSAAPAAVG